MLPSQGSPLLRAGYYGGQLLNGCTDKPGLGLGSSLTAGTRYLVTSVRKAVDLPDRALGAHTVALVLAVLVLLFVGLLVGLMRVRTPQTAALRLAAWSSRLILTTAVVGGGDRMPCGRFRVPALPLVVLLLGGTLQRMLPGARNSGARLRAAT